jgi:hypothetical protein
MEKIIKAVFFSLMGCLVFIVIFVIASLVAYIAVHYHSFMVLALLVILMYMVGKFVVFVFFPHLMWWDK